MKTNFVLSLISFITFLFLRFDVLAFFTITFAAFAIVDYLNKESNKESEAK